MELDQERAVVAAIEPGSPAAKAHVQSGDEMIAVEGKPLTGSVGKQPLSVSSARRLSTCTSPSIAATPTRQ